MTEKKRDGVQIQVWIPEDAHRRLRLLMLALDKNRTDTLVWLLDNSKEAARAMLEAEMGDDG